MRDPFMASAPNECVLCSGLTVAPLDWGAVGKRLGSGSREIACHSCKMSFFDGLRKAVTDIESEVTQLKQLADNGFVSANGLIDERDVESVKQLDRDVRSTYVEVSTLHNAIKGSPFNLNSIEKHIESMNQMMNDIENSPSLRNYGYIAWKSKPSQAIANDITPTLASDNKSKSLPTPCDSVGSQQTSAFDGKQDSNHKNSALETSGHQMNKKENECNKNIDKWLLSRTPQPYDFGIKGRQTLVPQQFLKLNKYVGFTPEMPTYDSSSTCRFNHLTTAFELPSNNIKYNVGRRMQTTPSFISATDSFVTVEFTPGLTTKRPKGVQRIKNRSEGIKDISDSKITVKFAPQVLQSVENDNITPEQPIPVITKERSEKVVRTYGKSGTPPMPQTRVNENLHNKLIKKK